MTPANQHQVSQPTISGYNVEEERSFLLKEDVAPGDPGSSTGSSHQDNPSSDDDDNGSESPETPNMSLAEELRAEMLRDEVKGSAYMPLHVLRTVMTRDMVESELKKHDYGEEDVQKYTSLICPRDLQSQESAYTKVFAALARLDKCKDIDKFVRGGLSDDKLPFKRRDGPAKVRSRFPLVENTDSAKEIQACKHWTADNRERFFEIQREFLVHFFRHRPERDQTTDSVTREPSRVLVEEIKDTTYLPWKERRMNTAPVGATPMNNTSPSMSSSYAGGAYGSVAPFEIGDKDHDFAELLDNIGLDGRVFAVKTLRRITRICDNPDLLPPRDETDDEMRRRFRQEADVLWRLDGTVHPHLLTMLTALTHNDGHLQLRFVFPWADCDLMGLWERGDASWNWDAESFVWMAQQIDGILGAVEKLHEPAHLHTLEQNDRRYGLHADIKPDNILLFRSGRHPRGILVLYDFGLSSFHREVTRSNIPNHLVMGTPGYSPPECDVEGGVVSRRYGKFPRVDIPIIDGLDGGVIKC